MIVILLFLLHLSFLWELHFTCNGVYLDGSCRAAAFGSLLRNRFMIGSLFTHKNNDVTY